MANHTFKMAKPTWKIIKQNPVGVLTENFVVSAEAGAAPFTATFFALIRMLSSDNFLLNPGLDSLPEVV